MPAVLSALRKAKPEVAAPRCKVMLQSCAGEGLRVEAGELPLGKGGLVWFVECKGGEVFPTLPPSLGFRIIEPFRLERPLRSSSPTINPLNHMKFWLRSRSAHCRALLGACFPSRKEKDVPK